MDTGAYPVAGLPWYACPFGRDGLITAYQALMLDPALAAGTLRYLAKHQGTKVDPTCDEEPGKILHESRQGELCSNGEMPFAPTYCTVDATPLFLVLIHEYYRWTEDLVLVRELWPNVTRALEWIDRYGDADGDGFVEYRKQGEKGLVNQGWKDSGDALQHPDGRFPQAPSGALLAPGMGGRYPALAPPERARLATGCGPRRPADRAAPSARLGGRGDACGPAGGARELGKGEPPAGCSVSRECSGSWSNPDGFVIFT